jgi:SAM-dependent methyltransferase
MIKSPSKLLTRYGINNFISEVSLKYPELSQPNKKHLFIGAGGEFQALTEKRIVSSLQSLDIDAERKPNIVCDAHDMNAISDNTYDCVFAFEVLEHCHSPFLVTKEIERVLKPNGLCIGSTPFLYPLHDLPFDFYRFTEFGLKKLFENFDIHTLRARQNYFTSITAQISRVFHSPSKKTRILAFIMSPIITTICIALLALNFLAKDQGTGGYVFVFEKRLKR